MLDKTLYALHFIFLTYPAWFLNLPLILRRTLPLFWSRINAPSFFRSRTNAGYRLEILHSKRKMPWLSTGNNYMLLKIYIHKQVKNFHVLQIITVSFFSNIAVYYITLSLILFTTVKKYTFLGYENVIHT